MAKRTWSIVLFTFSLGCLAFASYVLIAGRMGHAAVLSASANDTVTIPQPQDWIPFSADVVISHADDPSTAYGRFYRDAHGCGRLETGPKGETAVIYIHNIPRVEYYSWTRRTGEWMAGPMKLPAEGWKPMARRAKTAELQKHPLFVEVRRGRTYNLRSDNGLSAYRYVNISGTLSLQIPELNFFEVLKQNLEGRREVYSGLEIADQPEELFQPPAGAPIVTTNRLGGVVLQSKEDIGQHMEHMIRHSQR